MTTLISIDGVTDGTVEGNGTFDRLMQSTNAHLQHEYEAGRIHGSDYATVYLGGLQVVMQYAVQFELSKAQAGFGADLTEEQTKTQVEATRLAKSQANVAMATEVDQAGLAEGQHTMIDEQVRTQTATTRLATSQANVASATEIDQIGMAEGQHHMVDEQVLTQKQQTLVVTSQAKVATGTEIDQMGTVEGQHKLVDEQVKTQVNQTDNVLAQTEVTRQQSGFR